MSEQASATIREMILSLLRARGVESVGETEPLFSSGLLDSIAATDVLMALESEHGVDLADEDFDILQIDTLQGLETFLSARKAA
ncbi:acyl carrier protein [Rhizobium sp. SL86]|jgi:acyl carrier protein|uniref:acyl carrier protein n=1 Tax=Rhizobium sp. SL86 TaxID=2995148 RepID=UPI0022756156|nr:acyl carrier protein [Rhizobium sp. SL86]MCY1664289.1 acyl carrier protein [Rhizobium sp. SL86]